MAQVTVSKHTTTAPGEPAYHYWRVVLDGGAGGRYVHRVHDKVNEAYQSAYELAGWGPGAKK